MIARLRGSVVARTAEGVVLDVNGVGYVVAATPRAVRSAEAADDAVVQTYLHVREDALQLYGFADVDERELFVRLLSVSGVGPKVALAIVSASTPAELRRAIAREDPARFQAVPGVGRKTAERIVLELKEKLVSVVDERDDADSEDAIARDALIELGWAPADADRALAGIAPDLPPEERVRRALREAA